MNGIAARWRDAYLDAICQTSCHIPCRCEPRIAVEVPHLPQDVSRIDRAARQSCVFAAKSICLHARWRGDTMDWKKVRLVGEGVDKAGFKEKRHRFQEREKERNRKAGEVFWKCNIEPVPINGFAFAHSLPGRRRRLRCET